MVDNRKAITEIDPEKIIGYHICTNSGKITSKDAILYALSIGFN